MAKVKANSLKTTEEKKVNKGLTVLRAKLKRKYYLLSDSDLVSDDREVLLDRVCQVTGMYRKELDVVLQDL